MFVVCGATERGPKNRPKGKKRGPLDNTHKCPSEKRTGEKAIEPPLTKKGPKKGGDATGEKTQRVPNKFWGVVGGVWG